MLMQKDVLVERGNKLTRQASSSVTLTINLMQAASQARGVGLDLRVQVFGVRVEGLCGKVPIKPMRAALDSSLAAV